MANTTDPKLSTYGGPCPRCGRTVPNDTYPGEFPGALSRLDNATYICSNCGTDEAMFQFQNRDADPPVTLPPFDGKPVFATRVETVWTVYCETHRHYLVHSSVGGTTWTDDPNNARRYPTKEQAQKAAESATWLDHQPSTCAVAVT